MDKTSDKSHQLTAAVLAKRWKLKVHVFLLSFFNWKETAATFNELLTVYYYSNHNSKPVMEIRLCCQDQDQDQHLHNFQDQDQGKTFYFKTKTKTFLVFLYQSLRSLIQCQHKQQDPRSTENIYIVYHFIIFILMTIDNIAIRLDLIGMLSYFYFTSY